MEKLKDYIVLDTETTGLSPYSCKVIEVCASRVRDHKIVQTFTTLINPGCLLPSFIPGLTGITDDMVCDMPYFYEIAETLKDFIGSDTIVGHNIMFDISFLNKELGEKLPNKTVDTVMLTRRLIPGLCSYRLGNLCRNLNIADKQHHRAESDVYLTYQLYEYLMTIA